MLLIITKTFFLHLLFNGRPYCSTRASCDLSSRGATVTSYNRAWSTPTECLRLYTAEDMQRQWPRRVAETEPERLVDVIENRVVEWS